MRYKNGPQLSGAGRTRAGHHHGSHTPTSPEAILLGKMAYHIKQIRRECIVLINLTMCTVVKPSLHARMKLPSWPITPQDMEIRHL